MDSVDEKIQTLQKNFPNYKNFRRRIMHNLHKEIVEGRTEIQELRKQGNDRNADETEKNVKETEDSLQFQKDISQYERMPTKEDYLYRLKQKKSFAEKIQNVVNEDDRLCFHGTNIAATRKIFESGSISSGATRLGYHTSFDAKGAISVTNIRAIATSVEDYMNLTTNLYQPAGCLFIVKARNDIEYERACSAMSIKDVDFRENPDRLVAVVTTPENLEMVSEWARKSNVDVDKVMSFEGVIKKFQKDNEKNIDGKIKGSGIEYN